VRVENGQSLAKIAAVGAAGLVGAHARDIAACGDRRLVTL
jgi:hypothetical protein